jgi:hypothetical protein
MIAIQSTPVVFFENGKLPNFGPYCSCGLHTYRPFAVLEINPPSMGAAPIPGFNQLWSMLLA